MIQSLRGFKMSSVSPTSECTVSSKYSCRKVTEVYQQRESFRQLFKEDLSSFQEQGTYAVATTTVSIHCFFFPSQEQFSGMLPSDVIPFHHMSKTRMT